MERRLKNLVEFYHWSSPQNSPLLHAWQKNGHHDFPYHFNPSQQDKVTLFISHYLLKIFMLLFTILVICYTFDHVNVPSTPKIHSTDPLEM